MITTKHLIISIFLSLIIFSIGTAGYMIIEGWGLIDSIYMTIITITTVGYGDVVPHTALGQALASVSMLVGYAIIAVPTGVITAELAQEIGRERSRRACSNCERGGHEVDAKHCKYCGSEL